MIATPIHAPEGRSQRITGVQLSGLMQRLRTDTGIRIESPQLVIEHYVYDRMEALGVTDMGDYLALLDDSIGARAEWMALTDLLTVKETRFFRQPAVLDCTANYVQELIEQKADYQGFSFWSAGCSTGQEVYSVGMVLEHLLREHQPQFEWHGFGTDVSFQAIGKAQGACYTESDIKSVPDIYQKPYLQKLGKDQWQVSENIRTRTDFFHSNLLQVDKAFFSDFNIILCQNVLIYFEQKKRQWIIDQLVARLGVGGILILGAGEDVQWNNGEMRRVPWPGVCAYKKTGGNK